MSRIEDLITALASQRVQIKPLSAVAAWRTGEQLNRSSLSDSGEYPVINGGISPSGYHSEYNTHGDTITISQGGASAGYVSHQQVAFWAGAHCYVITPTSAEIEKAYLYYFLKNQQHVIQEMAQGAGIPGLSRKSLDRIRIRVPPLEVQREIVRILDHFTELEVTLAAELEARHHQYDFYRDQLLVFPAEGVQWIPIGELARIVRGASPRPIQAFLTDAEDGVPWIKIGDVAASGKYITTTAERVTPAGAAKSRRVQPGDFVLSNSMSFGRPYISKIEGCIHDGWLAISGFSESFIPDYLYHLLRSEPVQLEFARRAGSGTVQNLNADIVKAVAVPVPTLDEQSRIADFLDKFDALVNDPSVGLPAELAARRKQYEHYRDRLLTFDEAAA